MRIITPVIIRITTTTICGTDVHILKGDYRPFIPQRLRGVNLAALEVVDYVIVDENPTPLENILFLEPDYFAKGYEYSSRKVNPRTQEEMDVQFNSQCHKLEI